MTYEGNPVKASRLFAGNEHELQTKKIAAHFNVSDDFYKKVAYDGDIINRLTQADKEPGAAHTDFKGGTEPSAFNDRSLSDFTAYQTAYHQLMLDIMKQQLVSTGLVLKGSVVKRIFVDGGFSKNEIYMNLLSVAFPETEVFAASMAQATSLGAALAIHKAWNEKPLPNDIIELKYYSFTHDKV
jgi:ribulose kinase